MKNVKNHAKQRYCERILGITETNEWKHYIVQNDELICNHINKMVDNSLFIYRGQIGDNTTKVFRMADNIILVMDSQESCVITMFKCFFGFGDDMDRQIIKHELLRLDELHNELRNIEAEIHAFVEEMMVTTTTLDMQIKAMEEQLKLLKAQKTSAEEAIKGKKAGREFTSKEIEKLAVRLCNSIEYRRDLQAS